MIIDIIFIILMVLAIFKGYSRGLIVAVFSFFAFMIGLAAALKLSAVVASYLQNKVNVGGYFLPIISFAVVFIVVVFAIRSAAAIIRKVAKLAFLGWVDAFGGIVLYAIIYTMIYSIVLFYASKIQLIGDQLRDTSITYSFVAPLGPKFIVWLGTVIPLFSNMFSDLTRFFEGVSKNANR